MSPYSGHLELDFERLFVKTTLADFAEEASIHAGTFTWSQYVEQTGDYIRETRQQGKRAAFATKIRFLEMVETAKRRPKVSRDEWVAAFLETFLKDTDPSYSWHPAPQFRAAYKAETGKDCTEKDARVLADALYPFKEDEAASAEASGQEAGVFKEERA